MTVLRRLRYGLRKRLVADGDEGSALLFALVFITAVALVMGAVLTFVNTGNLGTTQFRDQRDRNNYIDGAVQAAMQAIRPSPRQGLPTTAPYNGVACPNYTTTAPGTSPGSTGTANKAGLITVTCQAQTPSPSIGGGGPNSVPQFAILTLGTGAGDGLSLSQNNILAVQGSVGINGDVDFASGTPVINDEGDVSILGNCDNHGVVTATGFVSIGGNNGCYDGTLGPAPSAIADPNYDAGPGGAFSVPGTVDPTPECMGSGAAQVVKFLPGYYSDAPVPPDACKDAPSWWFSPGSSGDGYYYFDFPDTDANRTWQLPAANVIAGASSGWTPGTTAPPTPTSTVSACDTASGANGVQFIIGGATQIAESDTNRTQVLQICSPHPSNSQQIALYALKTGTRTNTGTANPTPSNAGNISGDIPYLPGSTAFPEEALTFGQNKTAGINWSGFGNPVPAGAIVTSAQVTVVHTTSLGKVIPTITVHPAQTVGQANAPAGISKTFANCQNTCTNTYDFTNDLADAYKYQSINGQTSQPGMSIDFETNNSNTASASDTITSMTVAIAYTLPAVEGVHCANKAIGACTPTSVDASSNKNSLIVHGTTYLPTAAFNLYGHNKDNQLFDRGVIVKDLNCDVSASFKQLEALFSLPGGTPSGRTVKFTATIAGSATPYLIAYADYYDSETVGGIQVSDPGNQIKVTSWSVLR